MNSEPNSGLSHALCLLQRKLFWSWATWPRGVAGTQRNETKFHSFLFCDAQETAQPTDDASVPTGGMSVSTKLVRTGSCLEGAGVGCGSVEVKQQPCRDDRLQLLRSLLAIRTGGGLIHVFIFSNKPAQKLTWLIKSLRLVSIVLPYV
jgi:hypothetical protein